MKNFIFNAENPEEEYLKLKSRIEQEKSLTIQNTKLHSISYSRNGKYHTAMVGTEIQDMNCSGIVRAIFQFGMESYYVVLNDVSGFFVVGNEPVSNDEILVRMFQSETI